MFPPPPPPTPQVFKAPSEAFALDWEAAGWKHGSTKRNEDSQLVQMIHADETMETRKEFCTILTIYDISIPLEPFMQKLYTNTIKTAPEMQLVLLEESEVEGHSCIIFKFEGAQLERGITVSQLLFLIQGEAALYVYTLYVPKAKISKTVEKKWTRFFKSGRIVKL